MSVYHCF